MSALKALGFISSQLGAVVAWQSNVAVAIRSVVGIPDRIVAGGSLRTLFARGIAAVPSSVHPVVPIVRIALGALTLASVIIEISRPITARTAGAVLAIRVRRR